MYGVVRHYVNGSDLAEGLMQRQQEVRDLISGVPGFHHYSAIRSGGSVTTITVCDDQAGTTESSRRAREWVKKNLSGSSTSAPETTEGEVFLDFGA